ncbi:hypothetical protein [uncultured Clostridium sp.]|jgi:hypothetical protein|uniref:hypothetical protein n=1 Tax=uncultured Clostridium sp. TaxID=59620 RepID=UPI00280BA6DD|nr:hypothetical protein [uncultured Clostridium sp.]
MLICGNCKDDKATSWVHCRKGYTVCEKCCTSCKYLDSSTSYITCIYKIYNSKK